MPAILRAQVISFDSSAWTAVVLLDGSVSEVVMPVGEWVPEGMLAADDSVAVLLFDDSNPDDGVVLGPFGGLGTGWSYPALSGLSTGQPLRAASATAAAFGALDLANANAVTGALPHGKGGTGLSGAPGNGQLPIGNGSGYTLANVTGTANQVVVTNGAGTITLSLPQNVHTGAAPQFDALNLGSGSGAGTGEIVASGTIRSATDLRPSGTTGRIYWKHYDLNAGATATLCDVAIPYAFIAIAEYQNVGQVALFFVAGGTTVAFELSDPSGVWGAAAGASTYNIYHNGTNYVLQNNHATNNRKFRAMILSMSG